MWSLHVKFQIGMVIRMRLGEWLARQGVSQREFGEPIKTPQPTVQRYVAGSRMPRPAIMSRIIRVTKNQVTADDFLRHRQIPQPR